MSNRFLELAKDLTRREEALNGMDDLVLKVLSGECICEAASDLKQGFRCPVHCGGNGPCSA